MKRILGGLLLFVSFYGVRQTKKQTTAGYLQVWSIADKANDWYSKHKWISGANFIPSSAINQLEMWQADTYDSATIDRELGWAEKYRFQYHACVFL